MESKEQLNLHLQPDHAWLKTTRMKLAIRTAILGGMVLAIHDKALEQRSADKCPFQNPDPDANSWPTHLLTSDTMSAESRVDDHNEATRGLGMYKEGRPSRRLLLHAHTLAQSAPTCISNHLPHNPPETRLKKPTLSKWLSLPSQVVLEGWDECWLTRSWPRGSTT